MKRKPYDYPESYPHAWVYYGWDGINRLILKGGKVIPPFPRGK